MRTALDTPVNALDEDERTFVAEIQEHGWFRTEVLGDREGPGFSFSTGFWIAAGQPELILFGMKGEIAHNVLWGLFRDAEAGESLSTGIRSDEVFGNLPAYMFPIAKRHYGDYLGWSLWFYGGDDFPCLQIVWPDRAGLFPWEDGFDPAFEGLQPDLTEKGWLASLAA